MTDERSDLESMAEEAGSAPFRYRPIAKAAYDRDPFVAAYSELQDLKNYADAVDKDPHKLGARKDLCGLLFGRDKSKLHERMSPEAIKILAKSAKDSGVDSMGRYAEENFSKMFGALDDRALYGLVTSLQLYKTGRDNEHDAFVEIANEVRYLEGINNEKDPDKKRKSMRAYVADNLKNNPNIPDWAKNASGQLADNEVYTSILFAAELAAKREVMQRALVKEDGKLDEAKARKIIRTSLDRAKEAFDDETHPGAKGDIWKDVIRPYYLAVADAFYPQERKEYDADKPEVLFKIDERESERRELGMAA